MKTLLFYEMAPDSMAKAMENFPAHRARLAAFHARGVLLGAGPMGNPPEGAMGLFTSREAAEEFVAGDPFALNGVAAKWRLLEWYAEFTEPVVAA
ncbi:MAG: hypothetical protein K0Q91_1167 [Fibrobacteria bacterium]|jgi:uncharacterized protein YciI|nr:hypothetical protein [Fibrobacteria bacterium]